MGKPVSRARRPVAIRGVIALVAVLSVARVATAADVSTPTPTAQQVADFGRSEDVAIGQRDERMTVAVSVSGSGPYPFVIDTGAERTVLSRQLAEHLMLSDVAPVTIHGVANTELVRAVRVPNISIGSNNVALERAPLFEAHNIGAAGLLGVDALREQRVLIDFRAKTMSVSPSSDPLPRDAGSTIVVRALSYHGRLMFKHAMAGRTKAMMVIDTGSQHTIGNLLLLARLGRHVVMQDQPVMIDTVTGASVAARIGKIDELTIDDVHLKDIYVAFADASAFKALGLDGKPALLLGMNVMRAFDRVSIDFAQRRVRFTFPRVVSSNEVALASRTTAPLTRFP